MSSLLASVLTCLLGPTPKASNHSPQQRLALISQSISAEDNSTALEIIHAICSADTQADLDKAIANIITPQSWTSTLAVAILNNLSNQLSDLFEEGAKIGGVLGDAVAKAKHEAWEFAHEHPVWATVIVTVIALGVLIVFGMPWVLEAVGFSAEGVVEGSWAAAWQSTIGNVEKRSLFSFLQRMGMKWAAGAMVMEKRGPMVL